MQVNNHTATPPRPARAIRQWNGQEFEITLSWEPDSTINENLEFELKADENKQNVGTLKGFVCNGDRFLKVENADAVCREGGEVVADLIHRFPMLAEDSIDLVFLYKLQAEGKGRRIGQMLIREVAQILPTLSPNYSLLCWYASPLTANKTEDLTDRLIQYYRQLPAINPGKDKQMMLWDPNEVLANYGIEIRDRGARRGLLKKRGGRHSYYAVFHSGNDRISNTMLNSQIAAQKLTEMCRQALDTTARDMLEKHFPSGPLRTEEQKRQVKEDRLAGIKRALCGQSREGPTLWSFHVSHAQAAGVPNTLEVDDNNQAWASWSYGQIQCEAAQVPLREETVTSLVQTCTL